MEQNAFDCDSSSKKLKREPNMLLRLLNDMILPTFPYTNSTELNQTLSGNLQDLDEVLSKDIITVADFWDVIGNSLLKKALENGLDDLFKLLLKHAVKDRELGQDIGAELIQIACCDHDLNHAALLFDQGAQIKVIEGLSLLVYAYGYTELMVLLLAHGAPVDDVGYGHTDLRESCLNVACRDGDLDVIQLLFKHGADPDFSLDFINPPLTLASYYGRFEAVQLLLDHGADINAISISEEIGYGTALLHACNNEYFDIDRLLLERGADSMIPDKNGQTALDYVSAGSEIAQLISNAQLERTLK